MTDVKVEWEITAELGEGPTWVESENAIYWVDIKQNNLHRLNIKNSEKKSWYFDVAVTSIAARPNGGLVCTIADGYAFVALETGTLEPIVLNEKHIAINRYNDGKLDAKGRFWAGTMDDKGLQPSGSLYCLNSDLSINKMDDGYVISNGPAFSADNKTMYHTDTFKKTVYVFDFDLEAGTICNKRKFVEFTSEEEGKPDGMTVDSENCIWICHFGGHRITRYSQHGKVIKVYPLPVPNITSCTFAGPDLDTLYITTARIILSDEQLKKYPLSGSLFSFKPGVKGLATPLFAG